MSSYAVIREVSEGLRSILWQGFRDDPSISPIVGSEANIVFTNPTETARQSSNRLSLWLYQITENEFVKNQPRKRDNGAESERLPPLALNLYYLLTPFADSEESNQLLIGRAMQVLYDSATVYLRQADLDVAEELRIVFCRLTLEELTRIWEALREPYRLSICYQVRVTHIDSERVPSTARVIERDAGFGQKPAPPPPEEVG